ncbi:diacylglycerol acyltransferase [Polychytrium aggregatum]|uniref:diacylglycerol acyltransferase n=1 Tax=Polychytrium aggregatum TaxID=110093 RepID=UPI0022FEC7CA|nr:diacylglycerol acyltransferase [Polychytrium aggregatum]KAI9193161.1 diacylglycerol acyltransferase [Polychytrium aggregatum]
MTAIHLAPLHVPFARRRQTWAIATWLSFPFVSIVAFLLILVWPRLTLLALGYVVFILVDKSPFHGGRPSQWVRRLAFWRWLRDYFPVELVATTQLDPKKNYLFGYHPHGIVSIGAVTNFGTEANEFSKLFPGISLRLLTLNLHFFIPFWRDLLLSLGVASVGKGCIDNILSKGPGSSCMIVVGGSAEVFLAVPGTYDLVLSGRYGFVRVALKNGASLVPVFSFGENDCWDQVQKPKGTFVRFVQDAFKKLSQLTVPVANGRGFFNYDIGLLPRRRRIVSIVGAPIDCPKTPSPSEELVHEYHQKYIEGLKALYEQYKDQYAPDRKKEFTVI